MSARLLSSVIAALALSCCEPDLTVDDWLVTRPRVLAVRADPAEAPPGATIEYHVLVAAPDAALGTSLSYEFCSQPKPPAENNSVPTACLFASNANDLGTKTSFSAKAPAEACAVFGPNTVAGGFRPRDPDDTGGYYQPLRVDLADGETTFHFSRIQCGLAGADAAEVRAFGQSYSTNQNPKLTVRVTGADGGSATTNGIRAGSILTVEASWSAADAESYAYYDRSARSLTIRREAMHVAWYVDSGKLESASDGRTEDDPATSVSTRWTLPPRAGTSRLWVVLRDSRGGKDWSKVELSADE